MTWDDVFRSHRAILDESFSLQTGFVEFAQRYLTRSRRPLIVPEDVRGALRGAVPSPPPDYPAALPRPARLALEAVQLLDELEGKKLAQFPTAAGVVAALEALDEGGRLPPRVIVLENNPNTALAVEAFLRERLRRTRRHGPSVLYAEIDPLKRTPHLIASWYADEVLRLRRSPWAVLSRWLFGQRDPYPPFRPSKDCDLVPAEPGGDPSLEEVEAGGYLRGLGVPWLRGDKLGGGGEGFVYRVSRRGGRPTGDGRERERVCKLYKARSLRPDQREKLRLMISRPVPDQFFCWPEGLVFDRRRRWRGYLMAAAPPCATPLDLHVLSGQRFTDSPAGRAWRRGHSVQLAITVLMGIAQLHALNVLVGDLNPTNILVADERRVCWVDCDSFQVEGHVCPVGRPEYTAPELLKAERPYATYLRTKAHELFAVATLLFQILIPGQHPYSRKGGGTPGENILRGGFPYAPSDDDPMPDVPPGRWRACWSHLTPRLKKLFILSFSDDTRMKARVKIVDWLEALREYRDLLDDPSRTFRGPPTGFDLNILPRDRYHVPDNSDSTA
jgi:hypothetical protein